MAEYIDKHSMLNMIRPDDSGDELAAVTISDVKRLMRTLCVWKQSRTVIG